MNEMILEETKRIIEDCEIIQEGRDSQFTKEQEMIMAYQRIKELFDDYE